MRNLLVFYVYLFFAVVLGLTGLLFDLHFGFVVGIVFSIIILAFYFRYGEKIILLLAKARYVTDDENLINQIKNFSTHLEISEVKIYWSNVFYNNVYFANSYGGTSSIIIGREVYNQLTNNELKSLVYATLLRIKTAESKHRTMINLILVTLFWWVFAFESMIKSKVYKRYVTIFLYPAFYIKSVFFKKRDDTAFFDSEIFKLESLKRDYVSALFKINKMEVCHPTSMGTFVLSGLSHSYNSTNDALFYLLIQNEMPIEQRIKLITGNLK